jgi:hypothetical protein
MGPGFYEWTADSMRAVRELRDETIRAGRAFAERRRDVTP